MALAGAQSKKSRRRQERSHPAKICAPWGGQKGRLQEVKRKGKSGLRQGVGFRWVLSVFVVFLRRWQSLFKLSKNQIAPHICRNERTFAPKNYGGNATLNYTTFCPPQYGKKMTVLPPRNGATHAAPSVTPGASFAFLKAAEAERAARGGVLARAAASAAAQPFARL